MNRWRVNEVRKVVALVPLTFFHEPIPTPADNHISTPSVDRLQGHRRFPFGDHDPQVAVTPGTGALEVLGHSTISLSQAFVHHDPGNLQPDPFRQFFDAHGEPLKLKAPDLHD